jgi:short-subunit dehydrogenase involved in D-alanine esterification of teichoic acids
MNSSRIMARIERLPSNLTSRISMTFRISPRSELWLENNYDMELYSSYCIYRITGEHKDLDMIILNSGIQRGLNFGNPESIDLDAVDLEMQTNYFSYVHLLKAFLPFLQSKSDPTAIVFMTSGLALAPLSRCPNYCASKAALHSLIMSLRFQLQNAGKGDIKVIEILPPAVQSEYSVKPSKPQQAEESLVTYS